MTEAPSNWTETAMQFVRDALPGELPGRLYCVDHDWLLERNPELAGLSHMDGLAGPLAFLVQKPLQDADLWAGPGRTITARWLGNWQRSMGIVLHELAHLVADRHSAAGMHRMDEQEAKPVATFAASFADVWPSAVKEKRPWTGHEDRFLRACSHLWYRASLKMESLRPQHLRFGAAYYGFPFTEHTWVTALEPELGRTDVLVADLLDEAAPDVFVQRYRLATDD